MHSGIEVDEACSKAYKDLKDNKKIPYVILKINKTRTKVEVSEVKSTDTSDKTENKEDTGDKTENLEAAEKRWDDFVKDKLEDDVPCYVIYDFVVVKDKGVVNKKILLISWIPDSCTNTFAKMSYASSLIHLKEKLGITTEYQANDKDVLRYEDVVSKLK